MLVGINQNTSGLLKEIKDSGCLFLCFAQSSPIVFSGKSGVAELNGLWKKACEKEIIKNEMVQQHTALAQDIFCIRLKYDDTHHKAAEKIPPDVKMIFGKYVWKYSHFVLLDKNKNVIFDSLGQSNTVKNGKLESMRWYFSS